MGVTIYYDLDIAGILARSLGIDKSFVNVCVHKVFVPLQSMPEPFISLGRVHRKHASFLFIKCYSTGLNVHFSLSERKRQIDTKIC